MAWLGWVVLAALLACAAGEDLYCGAQSCYETLGVEPTVDSRELTQAYRKLAREVRPGCVWGGVSAATAAARRLQPFEVATAPPSGVPLGSR
jgi:hypothetical protein